MPTLSAVQLNVMFFLFSFIQHIYFLGPRGDPGKQGPPGNAGKKIKLIHIIVLAL